MPNSSVGSLVRQVGVLGLAALAFFVLSDVAEYWGGGLRPNPLWLATASTTTIALLVPPNTRIAAVAGGAVGCVFAGLLLFDETWSSLVTPCLGNTAESAIAVALLPRVLTSEWSLGRTSRAIAWIFSSVLAAAVGAIIATSDTSSQVIGDRIESMLRWTLGDTVGLLLLPPLVIAFRSPWIAPRTRQSASEAVVSVLVLAGLVVLAFGTNDPLPYMLVPLVMWIGLRFGPRLAAPSAFLTAMAATYLTAQDRGPFAMEGSDAVVQVQALNVALALSSLVASSHAVKAWRDQQLLRATLEAVPDVILTRDAEGRSIGAWGPVDLRQIVADLAASDAVETENPLTNIASIGTDGAHLVQSDDVFLEHRSACVDSDLSLHVYRDVSAEHREARALLELRNQIEDIRLETQESLAHDLHDGPFQSLSAARILFEAAMMDGDHQDELHDRLKIALDQSAAQLRDLMDRMTVIDETDVADALVVFGSDVLRAVNTGLRIEDSRTSHDLEDDTRSALVLIGREAILNAARHSGASAVEIDLSFDRQDIVLVVRDDGQGISKETDSTRAHLGLSSMHTRAAELGGTLDIRSDSNSGTEVRVALPR